MRFDAFYRSLNLWMFPQFCGSALNPFLISGG
jgi:hypothetical protein